MGFSSSAESAFHGSIAISLNGSGVPVALLIIGFVVATLLLALAVSKRRGGGFDLVRFLVVGIGLYLTGVGVAAFTIVPAHHRDDMARVIHEKFKDDGLYAIVVAKEPGLDQALLDMAVRLRAEGASRAAVLDAVSGRVRTEAGRLFAESLPTSNIWAMDAYFELMREKLRADGGTTRCLHWLACPLRDQLNLLTDGMEPEDVAGLVKRVVDSSRDSIKLDWYAELAPSAYANAVRKASAHMSSRHVRELFEMVEKGKRPEEESLCSIDLAVFDEIAKLPSSEREAALRTMFNGSSRSVLAPGLE